MPLMMYVPGSNVDTSAQRGFVTQADTDGGAQGATWGLDTDPDAEVMPSDDMDVFQPYGFSAIAPAATEYTEMDSSAGPAIVGFRVACPVTLAAGESAHWFDATTYAHAKSGEYVINSTTVKIGSGATKKVGLNGDPVNAATTMATWISQVDAFVFAAWSVFMPGSPPPTPTDFGTLAASSTKAKAE